MIEEICFHCQRLTACTDTGAYFLCEEHKDLKQYQSKKKKVKPLKPRSIKRAKQEIEYTKVRKEYLLQKPNCECCEKEHNTITLATEVHHKKNRIGDLLTDKRFFASLCRSCHNFIHLNHNWSLINGYMLPK